MTSNLAVVSQDFVTIENKPIATEQDIQPNTNILPFGQCKLKPTSSGYLPCMPALQKWEKIAEKHTINDNAILTEESFCMCAVGGKISVKDKGHSEVHIIEDVTNEDVKNDKRKEDNSLEERKDNEPTPSISDAVIYFQKM